MQKPVELTSVDVLLLETKLERISGLLAATVAHLDREEQREFADLIREGQEDARQMREKLIAKGAIVRPFVLPRATQKSDPVDVGDSGVRALGYTAVSDSLSVEAEPHPTTF